METLNIQDSPENQKLIELLRKPEMKPLLVLQQIQSAIHIKYITDRMPGGFFIYQADGQEEVLYVNDALLRLFGCETLEEFTALTGNTFPGMVHPDDIVSVEEKIRTQIAESQFDLDYVEYRIIQKDGTVRWVEDYGHFIQDATNGALFYVFVSDATDKRQQQMEQHAAELEAINQELRRRLKIIEGFSLDYESILYVNLQEDTVQPYQISSRMAQLKTLKQAAKFSQFSQEYIETWVHPEDREIVIRITDPAYIRERLGRDKAFHATYRVLEGGKPVYIQFRAANVTGDGPAAHIVLGYRRIDDEILREMEQKELLENALKRTKAAMAVKNTFLSNMSHDIRTPMNTVIGYTALAKRNLDNPEKLQGYLEQIEDASGQMLRLINNVLEYAQMENGDVRTEEQPCDLLDILHAVDRESRPPAEEKGLAFSVDISALQHQAVYTDRDKLEHILLHLVGNAVRYTGNGGSVRVSVTEHGAPTRDYAAYCFRIEDSGIGIDPEYLSKIFEPFERRKNTTQSGVFGTGLGLTLAKSMVELMGGAISVESEVNRGSAFIVSMLLRLQNAEKTADGALCVSSGQRRILLVEDNEINRNLCAEILRDAGFSVDTAEDGSVAVEKISASRPGDYGLVLMDIQMPVMDGNTAARAIRALPNPALAGIPIVALSANASAEDRKCSTESGMNAHVAKPIPFDDLLELVKKFMKL